MSWEQWSACSKSCGSGTRSRTRMCDFAMYWHVPNNEGCQPEYDTTTEICNTNACKFGKLWSMNIEHRYDL